MRALQRAIEENGKRLDKVDDSLQRLYTKRVQVDDPTHQIVANMHALNAERNAEERIQTKGHGDDPHVEEKGSLVEVCEGVT